MLGKKRTNQQKINKSESFLSKLHVILSDNTYNEIIHWDTDGKRIIVKDVINLCNLVLPKFYKHRNYSSFVRQLNMYGFHKSKGIILNGEGYEHEKYNIDSTKEEILQMTRVNKKMKILVDYIKSNQKEDSTTDTDFLTTGSEDDVLKYLYEKNEENVQNSLELKKEMEQLRKENNMLSEEITIFKSILNSHKLLLEKIMKKNNDTPVKTNQTSKNVKNLNDLFNKYLYHLKIYSPYVNTTNIKFKQEKEKPYTKIEKDKNEKLQDTIFNINSFVNNNESYIDELSIINTGNDFPFFDLNLNNNNSSKSFSKFFK